MFGLDTALLGAAAGLIVNAISAFRSPSAVAVTKVLPHAIRLAWSVSQGKPNPSLADEFLAMVPKKLAEAQKPKEDADDSERKPATKARK